MELIPLWCYCSQGDNIIHRPSSNPPNERSDSIAMLQGLHNTRHTVICDYDPNWKTMYEEESERIINALKATKVNISGVEHIGSTAVPNIRAKPIIDIMVVVEDIISIDQITEGVMEDDLGYLAGGEFGVASRRFFCKGDDTKCCYHVTVFEMGDKEIRNCLVFRDYMIQFPEEARRYESLKQELVRKYAHDRTMYTKSKTEFVTRTREKAKALNIRGQLNTLP